VTGQRFVRKNAGSSHSYALDGQRIPGVTTVKDVLNKPALVRWAQRIAAEAVVDNWQHLTSLTPSQRQEFVASSADRARNKAAARGTRIHAMAEALQHGKTVEVPDELRPQVEAVAKFLDAWDMTSVLTETPVCHTEYRYGGTLDAVLDSPRLGRVLVDFKTRDDGRAPYDDVALQLAPYRFADLRLEEITQLGPRGGKKPSLWREAAMVDVDGCGVIAVSGDSAVWYPVEADESVFDVFLHLLEVHYAWIKRTGWAHRDDAEFSPTVGEPVWPEQVPA
jgi:hypothetical protein